MSILEILYVVFACILVTKVILAMGGAGSTSQTNAHLDGCQSWPVITVI